MMLGKYERLEHDERLERVSYPSGSSLEVYISIIQFLGRIPWIRKLNKITRKDSEEYPDIYRFKGFHNLGADNFKVLEMIGLIERRTVDITNWKTKIYIKSPEFEDFANFWDELKDHVELDTDAYYLTEEGEKVLAEIEDDITTNQLLFSAFYGELNPPYLQLVTFDNELYTKLKTKYQTENVLKDDIRQLITSNPAGKKTEVSFILTVLKDLNIITKMQDEPEEKYGYNEDSVKEYVFSHSIKILNQLIDQGILESGIIWSNLKDRLLAGFNLHFMPDYQIINFENIVDRLLNDLKKFEEYEWKSISRQNREQMFRGDPTRHVIKIFKKFEYQFLMGQETAILG